MKKVIYVVVTPGYEPEMCKQTIPRWESYAKKIGGELQIISERKWPKLPPTYEKLQAYELGKDNDWTIIVDADMVVDGDMHDVTETVRQDSIGFWHAYDASQFFPIDQYFFRDGRKMGVSTNFIVIPRSCHDVLMPLDDPEQSLKEIKRGFILDEYCVSRNLARFGMKFMSILKEPGIEPFRHLNITTGLDESIRERNQPNQGKNAIVTITMGDQYRLVGDVSHPTIKAYADKLGADFIVLDEKYLKHHSHPAYAKLELYDILNQYDRILFVDTDLIIRADTPSLFNHVPETHLGLCSDHNKEWIKSVASYCQEAGVPMNWQPPYFNTGVMVASKCHQKMFEQPQKEVNNFYEQTHLNYQIFQNKFPVKELSWRFNRLLDFDGKGFPPRHQAFIIHYAGTFLGSQPIDIANLMKRDLEFWQKYMSQVALSY